MPRGKSKATLDLIDRLKDIYAEIRPATVRAGGYQLFIQGLIPSMEKSQMNKLSKALVHAREEGIIPWSWIVDEHRTPERISMWDDLPEFLEAARRSYCRNLWADQRQWIEVWSEKGTVRGLLANILQEYRVTFRVMHGNASATAVHDACLESLRSSKRMTALYVGDHDCKGMHMSDEDLPTRIDKYDGRIDLIRVALTTDDCVGLPSFPAVKVRGRPYDWYVERYGKRCWEVDALPPPVLRDCVENAIRSRMNMRAWNRALKRERSEQRRLDEFIRRQAIEYGESRSSRA